MEFQASEFSPIRPVTRALAAMQTAINAVGLAMFDGDLDRFGLYALIVAQTHPDSPTGRPIAIHSLAMSVGRPFETVRRHVNALIDRDLCRRVEGGVAIVPEQLCVAETAAAADVAHDSFVAFVTELAARGLVPAMPKASRPYHPMTGIDAAVNILFAAAESNRALHHDWTSLTIFSAVLLANARRYEAFAPLGGVPLAPAHAVRASVIGRVLSLPETTVRRRLALLTEPGGPLIRHARGLLVSTEWLARPEAAEASAATHAAVRRILARAAVNGFPFDDPASAYRVGPPRLRFQ